MSRNQSIIQLFLQHHCLQPINFTFEELRGERFFFNFFFFILLILPNTYQRHSSESNSSWLVASIPDIRISRHLGLAPIWCALSTHLSLGEMWSETADRWQMCKCQRSVCVSPCVVSTRPAISQCKGDRFRKPNENLLICGCGYHKLKTYIYIIVIGRVFQAFK